MSAAKQKGTKAERAVVDYLIDNGFPHAERRSLNGSKDRGDIAGIIGFCGEVKAGVRPQWPAWLRELAAEMENDGSHFGAVIHKPVGVGDTRVGDWHCVMPLHLLAKLLRAANQ